MVLRYENITTGIFTDRPNRCIAHVEVNGRTETVHVKNTGIRTDGVMEVR